jgi:hypothetical protein
MGAEGLGDAWLVEWRLASADLLDPLSDQVDAGDPMPVIREG